jgi:hypothetical protein
MISAWRLDNISQHPLQSLFLGQGPQTIKQCHKIRALKQKNTTELIDKPKAVVWDHEVKTPRTDALSPDLVGVEEKSAGMRKPTG